MRFSGQVDEAGFAQSANKDTSGRYHSNWLNMMYPRLFLARNLLREDGVIFVSIDDHEVHNLRHLMDEVFGEENFVAQILWRKRSSPPNDKIIGATHDYIICFARDTDKVFLNLRARTEEQRARYKNPDDHTRGPWTSGDLMANVKGGRYVASLHFAITNPTTGEDHYPGLNGNWRFSRDTIARLIRNDEIYFGEDGLGRPKLKRFLSTVKDGVTYPTIWDFVPLNTRGTEEMAELLGDMRAFENPKPVGLLRELTELGGAPDAIILDFFAGSGTTAQAVLELNAKDSGHRKFILVQLPEKTDNPKFPTIADIARERVRRVIAKLADGEKAKAENEVQATIPLTLALSREGRGDSPPSNDKDGEQDRGFRAFRLAASNFRVWDPSAGDAKTLEEQIVLHADNVNGAAASGALLYELILRAGLPVSARVVRVALDGAAAFDVNAGELMVCVEDSITLPLMRQMIAHKPKKIVCLDKAFAGDDAAKTNARLEAESHGVVFQTA